MAISKVYLDNMIVCGKDRDDLAADEMNALRLVEQAANDGKLEIVTSRETWREQDKTRDPALLEMFRRSRGDVPVVERDHRLLGFNHQEDQHGGFITSPMITEVVDESLFDNLKRATLKVPDARHLMYAHHNKCDVFLTTDADFLKRKTNLENLCPGIRILKPSQFIAELSPV